MVCQTTILYHTGVYLANHASINIIFSDQEFFSQVVHLFDSRVNRYFGCVQLAILFFIAIKYF